MRVLVADDEEANREVMEDAIELFGHDVVTVHSGQSAIDELSKSEFDFVLIDLNMGDMGGIEVVKKIRAGVCGPRNLERPVVAITGDASDTTRKQALDAGINEVLTKPVAFDELESTINHWDAAKG